MHYLSDLHELSAKATNEALGHFFRSSVTEADRISHTYGTLWRNMEEVVMHGGKRLRPYLTIVGYGTRDADEIEGIIPFAAAQELLHTALLMHDDIIDRDDIRHGIDNLNGAYKKIYGHLDEPDRTHFAHSAALLGGDLLIGAAHRLITASGAEADDQVAALAQLYQSIFEVAGGELMDVEASFIDKKELHAIPIAIHKTASYSFIGPLLTGARLAHASSEHIEALRIFGLNLGIAFQLQDDLLGIFGDGSITGKSTVNDIKEAKHTLLIEQYLASPKRDMKLYKKVFGNPHAQDDDISQFKQSLEENGIRKTTEQAVFEYTVKAKAALETLDKNHPSYDELRTFTNNITDRRQ